MQIRPYHPADFPALYAIEELCFQPPIRYSSVYLQRLIAGAGSATWIAEENTEIAGFTVVEWYRDLGLPSFAKTHPGNGGDSDCVAYIQTIEVTPAFRRRGIASMLLDRAVNSARSAGARLIWLHVESTNAAAIRLYRAHGFALQGSQDHYYARGRNADIYSKPLDPGPSVP